MPSGSHRPPLIGLGAVACAVAAALSLWPSGGRVRTADQNRDQRPDAWRVYDHQHRLSEASFDTNFDGRPDVREYYERGALIRRESDRNFNNRVDLVEDFDATTHEHVRSVIDIDDDGRADLLELFQGGKLRYSKWADRATPAAAKGRPAPPADAMLSAADGQLAPLEDPFRDDLAMRNVLVVGASGDCVGLSTSGGLPAWRRDVISPLAASSIVRGSSFTLPASASVAPYSPRGPPVALPLA